MVGRSGERAARRQEHLLLRSRVSITGPTVGPAVMTNYWQASEDATGAAAVRSALNTFLTAIGPSIHSGSVLSLEPELDIVDPGSGQVTATVPVSALSVTCSAAGNLLPRNVQGLIRWRTGFFAGGREIRGRTFVPGVKDGSNVNGVPSTGYVAALTSAATTLAADSAAELSIWSRKAGAVAGVSSGEAWTQFATLRSRRD